MKPVTIPTTISNPVVWYRLSATPSVIGRFSDLLVESCAPPAMPAALLETVDDFEAVRVVSAHDTSKGLLLGIHIWQRKTSLAKLRPLAEARLLAKVGDRAPSRNEIEHETNLLIRMQAVTPKLAWAIVRGQDKTIMLLSDKAKVLVPFFESMLRRAVDKPGVQVAVEATNLLDRAERLAPGKLPANASQLFDWWLATYLVERPAYLVHPGFNRVGGTSADLSCVELALGGETDCAEQESSEIGYSKLTYKGTAQTRRGLRQALMSGARVLGLSLSAQWRGYRVDQASTVWGLRFDGAYVSKAVLRTGQAEGDKSDGDGNAVMLTVALLELDNFLQMLVGAFVRYLLTEGVDERGQQFVFANERPTSARTLPSLTLSLAEARSRDWTWAFSRADEPAPMLLPREVPLDLEMFFGRSLWASVRPMFAAAGNALAERLRQFAFAQRVEGDLLPMLLEMQRSEEIRAESERQRRQSHTAPLGVEPTVLQTVKAVDMPVSDIAVYAVRAQDPALLGHVTEQIRDAACEAANGVLEATRAQIPALLGEYAKKLQDVSEMLDGAAGVQDGDPVIHESDDDVRPSRLRLVDGEVGEE